MLIYDVAFNADTDALSRKLDRLKKEVDSVFKPSSKRELISDAELENAKVKGRAAADFLHEALRKATSVDGLSLSRFNKELQKSKVSAAELGHILKGAEMHQNFAVLASTISTADARLNVLNTHLKEMNRVMTQSVKFRAAMEIQDFLFSQGNAAIQWTKDLDRNLNQIQIVSQKTNDQMVRVFNTMIQKAAELHTTLKNYSSAALIYYQQGLPDAETLRRTDITIKAALAAGEDARIMSENLTAIWNTYQMQGERLEHAASIAARLGAETAVDFGYIAEAMKISAAAASQMGLSYENLAAAVATVGETTLQTSSIVGTSLKTIIARFQQLKSSGLEGEIELGRISEQLAALGIHILDSQGDLRSLDSLIYELGNSWSTYSTKQQVAIAQTLGGIRQFGQVIALFSNWEKFLKNADSARAERSAETLSAQFETAVNQITVKAEQAGEAWSKAFSQVVDDDTLKTFYDSLKLIGDQVESLLKGLGGVPGILALIGTAASKSITDKTLQRYSDLKASISYRAEADALQKDHPGISPQVILKRKIGEQLIAAAPEGPEKNYLERVYDYNTLIHIQRLNDAIRTGGTLEKEVHLAEKARFEDLLISLKTTYENMLKLNDVKENKEGAAWFPISKGILPQVTSKEGPAAQSVEGVAKEIKDVFKKIGIPLKFEINKDSLSETLKNALDASKASLEAIQEEFNSLNAEISDSTKKIKELEAAISAIKSPKKQGITTPAERGAATREIKKIEAELAQLGVISPDAPYHISQAKHKKKADKAALEAQMKSASGKQKEKKQAQIASLSAEISRLDEEEKLVKEKLARIKTLNARLAELLKEQEIYDKFKSDLQRKEKLEKKAAKEREKRDVATKRQEEIEKNFPDSQIAAQEVGKMAQHAQAYESIVHNIEDATDNLGVNIDTTGANIGEMVGNLSALSYSFMSISSIITDITSGSDKFAENLLSYIYRIGFAMPSLITSVNTLKDVSKVLSQTIPAFKAVHAIRLAAAQGEVTAETVLNAAKTAGIALDRKSLLVSGELTLAKVKEALAHHGVSIAINKENASLATNAAILKGHPLFLLGATLLALAATWSLLAQHEAKHTETLIKNAKAQADQAEALKKTKEGLDTNIDSLKKQQESLESAVQGSKKQKDALKEIDDTLQSVSQSLDSLNIDYKTIQLLEQSAALAKTNGQWDTYNKNLEKAISLGEKQRLEKADQSVNASLSAARAISKGKDSLSVALGGLEAKDINAIVKILDEAGFNPTVGDKYLLQAEVAFDFSDPQKFVQSYDNIVAVHRNFQALENTTSQTLAITQMFGDKLAEVKEQYDQIKQSLPDQEISLAQKLIGDTKVSIKDVQEYRRAVGNLAAQLVDTYQKTPVEALRIAEQYYDYLSAQNTEVAKELSVISSQYHALNGFMKQLKDLGLSPSQGTDVFTTLTDEERVLLLRVDLRGYDGGDLLSYVRKQFDLIRNENIAAEALLDKENIDKAKEALKKGDTAELKTLIDWGNEKKQIDDFTTFLKMSTEKQYEYLDNLSNKYQQDLNTATIKAREDLNQHLINATGELARRGGSDANLEEYVSSLKTKLDSADIQIEIQMKNAAEASANLDELSSKLQNGTIDLRTFEAALDDIGKKEAEAEGLDGAAVLEYADHLAAVAKDSPLLADSLAENRSEAIGLAIAIQKMNRGVSELSNTLEDGSILEILRSSSSASQEFSQAARKIRNSLTDILNVEKKYITNRFVQDHLEDIELAAQGSEDAIRNLQRAAAEDIVAHAYLEDEDLRDNLLTVLEQMQGVLDRNTLDATFNIDGNASAELRKLGEEFINTATKAGMSVEAIQAALEARGYDAEITTSWQRQTQQIPIWEETYEYMPTGGDLTLPPRFGPSPVNFKMEKRARVVRTEPMETFVPVNAVKIKSINGVYGGNIQDRSSINPGNSPKPKSGGGGGSAPKTQKSLQRPSNTSQQLKYLSNVMKMYEKIEFYGDKEIKRLEKQADLQKDLMELNTKRAEEEERLRDEALNKMREKYGAVFEVDEESFSYLTNLEELVAQFGDTSEELANALDEYIEAEERLVNAREEMAEAQEKWLDRMLEAALSVNKQSLDFQKRAIEIANAFQAPHIRGARILTDAGDNLYGEMARKEKYYSGAARLLNMYFNNDKAMLRNFHNIVDNQQQRWEKIQKNNALAEKQGWAYSIDGNMADRKAMQEEMHAVLDDLVQTQQELFDVNEKVWENFNAVLSEWSDRLDILYNKFDGMKSVVSSMLDIAKLTTVKMFTPEQRKTLLDLQKTQISINKQQVSAAKQRMDAEQANLNAQKAAVQDFINNRNRDFGKISDDEFARQLRSMAEMTKQMEENLQKATDEYWSAFKGSVEDAWDYYRVYGEEIIYKMRHNLATGKGFENSAAKGSWSFLGQMMGFKDEKLDRTLNPGAQVRQASELLRELEKMDIAQIESMDIYNSLMDDLMKAKNNEVKLTEYDYNILRERFNLIKAQAAFEDARNAKNTMRLARDASGNWSYIYSSDPDDMKKKEQEIEDSLNRIYELSYDRVRALINELYGLPDELAQALSKLNPNDPQYDQQAIKIKQFYQEKAAWITNQINIAEQNSANVHKLVVQSKITDLSYLQSIQKLGKVTVEDLYGTELGWISKSEEGNKHLSTIISQTVEEQIANWRNLQSNISDSFNAAGQDIDNFGRKWITEAQKMEESAKQLQGRFTESVEAMKNAISTMISQENEWAKHFSETASSIIDSIRRISAEILALEGKKLGLNVNPETGNVWKDQDYAAIIGRMIENRRLKKGADSSADVIKELMAEEEFRNLVAQRDAKIESLKLGYSKTSLLLDLIEKGDLGWDNQLNTWVYWDGTKRVPTSYEKIEEWIRAGRITANTNRLKGFATGGLVTGVGGEDSVIARLSPGEYVLNPRDTKEFFSVLHEFLKLPKRDYMPQSSQSETKTLNQQVTIQADFPNVSSRDEIQAALNNLINQARQYRI